VKEPAPFTPNPEAHRSFLGRRLTAATEILALAGGLLMLTVATLITASVLMRWLVGDGISGDFELVQIATALSAFAFLPFCQARRGNVIVDTFTSNLPRRATLLLDATWDLLYAAIIAVLSWRLVLGARDAFASQTTSMVLGIPQGYAIAACACMGVLLTLIAAVTAARLVKSGR
jgi:TRAP-type C4-dicarboxylate transport system permease small subunit